MCKFLYRKNPSVTDSELRRSFFKICVTQEKFQRYVLDWPCIFLDQKTKQFFFKYRQAYDILLFDTTMYMHTAISF